MRGIDISHWQSGIDLSAIDVDFVICKATEGIGFVDKTCDNFIEQCKANNLLWGFYHFARENNPEDEAQFFYDNCKNYFNHGIPVLDYETTNYNNVEWCERFINKLHELSGVWCIIYLSASWCGQFEGSWVPEKCGLWVAGYPYVMTDWTNDEMPYNVYPFSVVAIWQFTSSLVTTSFCGKLDANIAYMDKDAWMKYANSTDNQQTVDNSNNHGKTTDDLVLEVILGEYGINDDRKRLLGSRYEEVQNRINQLYTIADEVIAGKWGNGWNRQNALNGAGYPYEIVQRIVNEKLA